MSRSTRYPAAGAIAATGQAAPCRPRPCIAGGASLIVAIAGLLAGAAAAMDAPAPGGSASSAGGADAADAERSPEGAVECPAFIFRQGFEPGQLAQVGAGMAITYTTSGGYTVKVDMHTITMTDPYGRNNVQHWGDPHENLNGKHIKDWAGAPGWDGSRRSILLGDGTKVTMEANGPHGLVLLTSIYDDNRNAQIENSTNVVLHQSHDPADTQARDDAQHDGEAAIFHTDPLTATAVYTNVYNENAEFELVTFGVPLGGTGGCANPNQVNDYFDDPRIGHT